MSNEGNNDGGAKVPGIQLLRLKEILRKWQIMMATNHKEDKTSGLSPAISRRVMDSNVESDEESCRSPDHPPDVPRGYLAVYAGIELRRFVIPTSYLAHPVFKILLEKAEEEFGFGHAGALTLPCETETFKYLLQAIAHNQQPPLHHHHHDDDGAIRQRLKIKKDARKSQLGGAD